MRYIRTWDQVNSETNWAFNLMIFNPVSLLFLSTVIKGMLNKVSALLRKKQILLESKCKHFSSQLINLRNYRTREQKWLLKSIKTGGKNIGAGKRRGHVFPSEFHQLTKMQLNIWTIHYLNSHCLVHREETKTGVECLSKKAEEEWFPATERKGSFFLMPGF